MTTQIYSTSATQSQILVDGVPVVTIDKVGGITKGSVQQMPVLGTVQNPVSGTLVEYLTIPNWINKLTLSFINFSTSGTSPPQIQIGSGSYATSGYLTTFLSLAHSATANITNPTTGFLLGDGGSVATSVRNGVVVLNRLSGNIWMCNGTVGHTDALRVYQVLGQITLGGALDRIKLTTVGGTDTFDAGSVNILYE